MNPNVILEREFFSGKAELREIPKLLEELRTRCPISDDQFFNLVVALTEAVNNAVTHGNRLDPAKRVRYRLECRQEGIHCVVEDQGEGFDPDEVADPVSPENLLQEGGRGMFLIRRLMQDLRLSRTGEGMRVEFLCARE